MILTEMSSPAYQNTMHVGNATTAATQRTFHRQMVNKSARRALRWGMLNLVLALICIFEIAFASTISLLGWEHPVFWYLLFGLAVLFSVNFVVDFAKFIIPTVQGIRYPVELSPYERDILGVRNNAIGFKTATPRPRVPSAPPSLRTTPVKPGIKPSSSYLYSTPPSFSTDGGIGLFGSSYGNISPLSKSFATPTGSPGSFNMSTPQGGLTMNRSSSMNYHTPSPLQQSNTSLLTRDGRGGIGSSGSFLRSRHQSSPVNRLNNSPLAAEDTIADMNSLNNYLKTQEERRALLGSTESSPSGSPSFFAYNRSASDFTYLLGRQHYQLASRSPQSPSLRKDDDPDYPAKYSAAEAWLKMSVNRDELERWTANLRKWLSEAIFSPVCQHIHLLNEQLQRVGHGELQVGESSLSSLKQVAILKSGQLPTLNQLIPYLDVSPNQEYVVQRIQDLGQGGYINEFRWDKGGDYKGRKWEKDLPSDCSLVMHMFCSFMDSQLPPDPKYPDGKTFTSRYFMKTPDKPDLKKDNILMFQTKETPPHYKVIIGDDTWDLSKGRNNMFHAILLFLHHIRSKHHGMLGRVNLGPAGINLLWIIKDDLQKLLE